MLLVREGREDHCVFMPSCPLGNRQRGQSWEQQECGSAFKWLEIWLSIMHGFLVRAPGLPLIRELIPIWNVDPQPWSGDLGRAMHLIRNPQSSQRWSETLSYFCSLLKLSDLCLSQCTMSWLSTCSKQLTLVFQLMFLQYVQIVCWKFSVVHKWQKPVFFVN